MKKVGILMGSDTDLPVVQKAIDVLRALDVPFEAHVMSAHRTPKEASAFAAGAIDAGFGVLIGAAGMAAHLAGALAANTVLPVIGLPIRGGAADGLDALLATVEMPGGIPACWRPKSLPSATRRCAGAWPTAAPPRPRRCWKRTPGCSRRWRRRFHKRVWKQSAKQDTAQPKTGRKR